MNIVQEGDKYTYGIKKKGGGYFHKVRVIEIEKRIFFID